jgi:hypothetical protein
MLVAPRRGGGGRRSGGKFNFGKFLKGAAKGVGSVAKHTAPIVLPIAIKALMGAGPPKKKGRKKGGATRKPKLIGYY